MTTSSTAVGPALEPHVVLVHGAWHGDWCWHHVRTALADHRIAATAVQLPLTSLRDDVDTVLDALHALPEHTHVLLCRHSYGGTVITAAGTDPRVRQLLYLCAVVPKLGEATLPTGRNSVPTTDPASQTVSADPNQAAETFYNRCLDQAITAAIPRLRPMARECFTTPVTTAAWQRLPATYVLCSEDHAIPPQRQRMYASRCTRALTWDSDHSPFISQPRRVSDLIAQLCAQLDPVASPDTAATETLQ